MEHKAALYWTPDFMERFKSVAGYSVATYLPLLFTSKNTWMGLFPPYLEMYYYGNQTTEGESVHQLDYRRALNDAYRDYLSHFASWAHSRGLQYSSQPAYNLPLEMVRSLDPVRIWRCAVY